MNKKLELAEEKDSPGFNEERERMHRLMLSSVSHDLKTPLASIIGSLEIHERMRDKLQPEARATLLETALQEAYRLDNFITNILDMAKLESGAVKPQMQLCDLAYVFDDCLLFLNHRLEGSDVTVTPVSGKVEVVTDSGLLYRALCLLLDNAVKYGGEHPVIRAEYGIRGGKVFINVSDNGQGIPETHLETIFSKYTRLRKKDHQNAGTGLGLAICRQIMKLLGGDVKAANRKEGGATFELSFPVIQS